MRRGELQAAGEESDQGRAAGRRPRGEEGADLAAKEPSGAAGADVPRLDLLGVGPHQVAEGPLVRDLLDALDDPDLKAMDAPQRGRRGSQNTQLSNRQGKQTDRRVERTDRETDKKRDRHDGHTSGWRDRNTHR